MSSLSYLEFSRCATNHTPQEIKECGRCAALINSNRFIWVLGVQKIALLIVIWGEWWREIALAQLKIQGLLLTYLQIYYYTAWTWRASVHASYCMHWDVWFTCLKPKSYYSTFSHSFRPLYLNKEGGTRWLLCLAVGLPPHPSDIWTS